MKITFFSHFHEDLQIQECSTLRAVSRSYSVNVFFTLLEVYTKILLLTYILRHMQMLTRL